MNNNVNIKSLDSETKEIIFPETTVTAFIDDSNYVKNKFGENKTILFIDTIFDEEAYKKIVNLIKKYNIPYVVRKARIDNSCRINIDVTNLQNEN